MLFHSLASKYARFVVLVRQMYWTPPFRPLDPPLLKSDDLFFREPIDIGPPPFKNPGHAPEYPSSWVCCFSEKHLFRNISKWQLRMHQIR